MNIQIQSLRQETTLETDDWQRRRRSLAAADEADSVGWG